MQSVMHKNATWNKNKVRIGDRLLLLLPNTDRHKQVEDYISLRYNDKKKSISFSLFVQENFNK
jgi:hypothetical protein